jgi:hypothetical protein
VSEFIHVTHPAMWPNRCFICYSQTGPLVDTTRESQLGRVYVCELCVTLLARCLGMTKGKRHTELLQAGKRLDEAEKQLADRDTTLAAQLDEIVELKARIEGLDALLQFEKDQASAGRHLFEIIQEQARAGVQPKNLSELEEAIGK